MWLAYLDESGNTGLRLDDPQQPVHWMVAVLVPEDQVRALTLALDGVVQTLGAAGSAELRGSALFGGDGDWAGMTPQVRVNVYRESLALMSAHDCVVAHSSIDKRRLFGNHHGQTSSHVMAFQFLTEKIDAFVGSQEDPLRQRVMLIADETDEHSVFQIDLVSQMQRGSAGVGSGRTLLHTIDTVHFVDSRRNPRGAAGGPRRLRAESHCPAARQAAALGRRRGAPGHGEPSRGASGADLSGHVALMTKREG